MSTAAKPERLRSFRRDDLRFDVRDSGPLDGDPVVLLHGWPGGADTWTEVERELAGQGWRTFTPDQRGYSPEARPSAVKRYAMPELVDDALALLDAAGLQRAHVVGHDWGGAVSWALASRAPTRVCSLTVLSTPHPAAMARALVASDQAFRSAYVAAFQVRWLPERVLLAHGGHVLREVLRRSGLDEGHVDRYVERQREPGALSAGLSWYRALLSSPRATVGDISVPTLYVWSTGDAALGRAAAEGTGDHVTGPYRFEILEGFSHWLPETVPALVGRLIDAHARENPAVSGS